MTSSFYRLQMRRSMSTVAARRRKRTPQSRRENPGMIKLSKHFLKTGITIFRGTFSMEFALITTFCPTSSRHPAPLSTCQVSQLCAATSSACSRRTKSGQRRSAASSSSRSSSSASRRSTSASYWPRGRNALSSRRSRGGGWRRLVTDR